MPLYSNNSSDKKKMEAPGYKNQYLFFDGSVYIYQKKYLFSRKQTPFYATTSYTATDL